MRPVSSCLSAVARVGLVLIGWFVVQALHLPDLQAQVHLDCVSCTTYAVSVTPDGSPRTRAALSSGFVDTFTVTNTGTNNSEIYDLVCTPAGAVSGCSLNVATLTLSSGNSGKVIATYGTGSAGLGTLTLRATGRTGDDTDTGLFNVTATGAGAPVISTGPHNGGARLTGLCAASCFNATYAHSTVSYTTLGTSRSATLVYNSGTVKPRPVVLLDVSLNAQTTQTPTHYSIQLKRVSDGTNLILLDGATSAYYRAVTPVTRLAAAFRADTNGFATGVQSLNAVVTAYYPSGTVLTSTSTVAVLIEDRSKSEFGAGVGVAGLQRLYLGQAGGIMASEGDGSLVFYAGGTTTPGGTSISLSYSASTHKYRRTALDSSYVEFDSVGKMTKSVDRFGNTTTINYEAAPNDSLIQSIVDPKGKSIAFCYSSDCGVAGKLFKIWVLSGTAQARATSTTINGSGRLIKVTDPDGKSDSLAYNGAGLLSSVWNRARDSMAVTYDSLYRVDSTVAPSVAVDTGGTGGMARPTTRTTADVRTVWQPGVTGVDTAHAKAAITPAAAYAFVRSPLGDTTRYLLDRFGAPIQVQDPYGSIATATRDTMSRPLVVSAPNGDSTTYTYTGYDLTSRALNLYNHTVNYTYDGAHRVTVIASGSTSHTEFEYYGNGALKNVYVGTAPNRYLIARHFPLATGQDTAVVDSSGHRSRVVYETTWGNPSITVAPNGATDTLHYDSFSRVDQVHQPLTPVVRRGFGTMDQVLADTIGLGRTVQYAYDSLTLRLLTVTDGKGQLYKAATNALGWPTLRFDVKTPTKADSLRYDLAGRVTKVKTRRGDTIAFTYDKVGRVKSRSGPDFPAETFRYDTLGAKWTVSLNLNGYDSTWVDRNMNAVGASDSIGAYMYKSAIYRNTADQVSNYGLSRGATQVAGVGYIYDGAGNLNEIYPSLNADAVLNRNSEGLVSSITHKDIVRSTSWTETRSYDSTHAVVSQRWTTNALGADSAFGTVWTRDALERIRSRKHPTGASPQVRMFAYDSLGELVNACDSIGAACTNVNGGSALAWAYDSAGNRRDVGGTATYGPANQDSSYNGMKWIYDSVGQATRKISGADTLTYTWNAIGQLIRVRKNGALVDSIGYDALGRRAYQRWALAADSVEKYVYVGSQVVLDLTNADAIKRTYAWELGTDRLYGVMYPSDSTHWQIAIIDLINGSVRGLVRSDAPVLTRKYSEAPWGDMTPDTSVVMRFRFAGREFDQRTGLYYMRARYYDPQVGRFLSEDPAGIGGGLNLYQYAGADPINARDPSGLGVADYEGGDGGGCPLTKDSECFVAIGHPYWDDPRHWALLESPFYGPPPNSVLSIGGPYAEGGAAPSNGNGPGSDDVGKNAERACTAAGLNMLYDVVGSVWVGAESFLAVRTIAEATGFKAIGAAVAGAARGNYRMMGKDYFVLGRAGIKGGAEYLAGLVTGFPGAIAQSAMVTGAIDGAVGNGYRPTLGGVLRGALPILSLPSDLANWNASCFPE